MADSLIRQFGNMIARRFSDMGDGTHSDIPRQDHLWTFTTAVVGAWKPRPCPRWVYSARVNGTGAVSATIKIWVRTAEDALPILYATITLSGTTVDSQNTPTLLDPYAEHMVEVFAISAGATVTVNGNGGL